MVRIQDDLMLEEVMDRILDEYAAVPPSDYKKQLRFQIRNKASQDEGFRNAFEREIEDEFSEPPRLDEIEDFINEMSPTLKDILDQYGVRARAKEFTELNKMAEGGAK